ncbi:hypothetical protein SDC9_191356 [bioreactor metagenome]|uniref:Uncharacterized protein n=1 Tax=bioreactor metagenome TaxID=1076179 RepID=A0A645HXN3_9ZZZZ
MVLLKGVLYPNAQGRAYELKRFSAVCKILEVQPQKPVRAAGKELDKKTQGNAFSVAENHHRFGGRAPEAAGQISAIIRKNNTAAGIGDQRQFFRKVAFGFCSLGAKGVMRNIRP